MDLHKLAMINYLIAQMEGVKAEIEGMKAANAYDLLKCGPPSYDKQAFDDKATILCSIANQLHDRGMD